MRASAFIALGLGFFLMGAGLFALTMRKPGKPAPANPTKTQLREQAALAGETKKMRLAAAVTAGFGIALALMGLL
jgi:hypothetical protein